MEIDINSINHHPAYWSFSHFMAFLSFPGGDSNHVPRDETCRMHLPSTSVLVCLVSSIPFDHLEKMLQFAETIMCDIARKTIWLLPNSPPTSSSSSLQNQLSTARAHWLWGYRLWWCCGTYKSSCCPRKKKESWGMFWVTEILTICKWSWPFFLLEQFKFLALFIADATSETGSQPPPRTGARC